MIQAFGSHQKWCEIPRKNVLSCIVHTISGVIPLERIATIIHKCMNSNINFDRQALGYYNTEKFSYKPSFCNSSKILLCFRESFSGVAICTEIYISPAPRPCKWGNPPLPILIILPD